MSMAMLHFTLQFPVFILKIMCGVLMLMRWQWARNGRIVEIDPLVTLLLALFLMSIGIKQGFWMLHGGLLAAGLDESANYFARGNWVPIIANAAIIATGAAVISRVGQGFIGGLAYLAGVGGCAALIIFGAAIASKGAGG